MRNELKDRIIKFIKNAPDSAEKVALLNAMGHETYYVDLPNMALCEDDLRCSDLTREQLEELAEKLDDALQAEFAYQLCDMIDNFRAEHGLPTEDDD